MAPFLQLAPSKHIFNRRIRQQLPVLEPVSEYNLQGNRSNLPARIEEGQASAKAVTIGDMIQDCLPERPQRCRMQNSGE